MTLNPKWISEETADSLIRMADFLEKEGPSTLEQICSAFPEWNLNRVTRMLFIMKNWRMCRLQKKEHIWAPTYEKWRDRLERKILSKRGLDGLKGQERKREILRIRRLILQALDDAGDATADDLTDALDGRVPDFFVDYLLRKGIVVKTDYGRDERYCRPSAGAIDLITAELAAKHG